MLHLTQRPQCILCFCFIVRIFNQRVLPGRGKKSSLSIKIKMLELNRLVSNIIPSFILCAKLS